VNDLPATTDYLVLATLRRVGVRRSPVRVQFINRKIIIKKQEQLLVRLWDCRPQVMM